MTATELNWALIAVSLFNTVLLLWLGLTLWLNADRRNPGIAVTAAAFFLGSLFFISHSALLLSASWQLTRSNTLWLALGMTPILILPFFWRLVLLWYAGYWTEGGAALRARQRPWTVITGVILAVGFVCLLLLGIPFLPGLNRLMDLIWPLREFIKTPILGIPLVAIGFPFYVVLCVALSLDALRHPAPTPQALDESARRRVRPWLTGATLLLLLVGILVAVVVVWTITNTRESGYYVLRRDDLLVISGFDLVIALLIAVTTVLLGQAMTAYELFMGKTLPRRGLARHWKRAIALAAGYGVLLGGALAYGLEPVYAVLLTAVLMTAFFALLSWRVTAEWSHAMRQLRPLVTNQGWYERLTAAPERNDEHGRAFRVLCEQVLNTSVAYLNPVGPLSAFVSPETYPPGHPPPGRTWANAETLMAGQLAVPVDPVEHDGACWAIPLWSARGQIGVLLLGERVDGSLYTEEEIEVARAVSERLLDAAAGVALSQRLMRLQREQMANTQLLDQRTRRVLHDEVLPLIHTAMLSLPPGEQSGQAVQRLSEAHSQVSTLLRDLPMTTTPDVARLGPLAALRKAIEGEFGPAFIAVTWECDPVAEQAAADLPPMKAETLYYAARELVRNAARHAQPAQGAGRKLRVSALCERGWIRLAVEDNGEAARAYAAPGHGLELHTTLMAIAGGSLTVEEEPGKGTRGVLVVPL